MGYDTYQNYVFVIILLFLQNQGEVVFLRSSIGAMSKKKIFNNKIVITTFIFVITTFKLVITTFEFVIIRKPIGAIFVFSL